jgi:hypothetical protein
MELSTRLEDTAEIFLFNMDDSLIYGLVLYGKWQSHHDYLFCILFLSFSRTWFGYVHLFCAETCVIFQFLSYKAHFIKNGAMYFGALEVGS